MGEKCYFISEASKLVGVEAHVLRYWEEQLELPIKRNEMGHRYYIEEDIRLMQNIKQIMDKGIQLRAVKMLLPGLIEHQEDTLTELMGSSKQEQVNDPVETEEMEELEPSEYLEEEMQIETIRKELEVESEDKQTETMETIQSNRKELDQMDREEAEEEEGGRRNDIEHKKRGEGDPKVSRQEVMQELLEGSRELVAERPEVVESTREMRMLQFQEIMSNLIGQALQRNNAELAAATSEHVTERVIKEMDYLMRVRDSQEEERYKKLDETIRSLQKSRAGKRLRRGKR